MKKPFHKIFLRAKYNTIKKMPHITDILKDSGHACNPADQQEEDEEETKNEGFLHAVMRLVRVRD